MTDEKRCASCKHWRVTCYARPWWQDPCDTCVDCQSRKEGRCFRGDAEDGKAKDGETLMWGDDASGYCAYARTLPTFGCVMWEPKP